MLFAARNALFTAKGLVTFDSVGAGNHGTTGTLSWSDTIGSGAGGVLAMASVAVVGGSLSTVSATVGSTSMTQLGSSLLYATVSTNHYYLVSFGLTALQSLGLTGSQTVAFTFTGTGTLQPAGDSMSYNNVSSFGTPVTNTAASGTPVTVTASGNSSQRLACLMASALTSVGSLSAFNQTQQYNQAEVSGGCRATLIGDAPGASSVTFSATAAANSGWGAMVIPVMP